MRAILTADFRSPAPWPGTRLTPVALDPVLDVGDQNPTPLDLNQDAGAGAALKEPQGRQKLHIP